MDPTLASQSLASLEGIVLNVSVGMQEWAWAIFTVLTLSAVTIGYAKHAAKGDLLPTSFFGQETITRLLVGVAIIGYFTLSLPFMEVVRQTGMELSGSGQETVPIGEIARQADTVTERVNATIASFQSLGWIDQVKAIPQLLSLRIMNGVVHIIYIVIALISYFVYAKFLFGYLVGGFFVGFLSTGETGHFGQRSYSYLLVSTMPLFLLAVLQGYSTNLLYSTIPPAGVVKLSDIWALMWSQCLILVFAGAAVGVPREWLAGAIGSSGVPSASNAARQIGGAGSAVRSSISSISSTINSGGRGGGGGGRSLPPPSGGGGSGGGAPKLSFTPSNSL